MTALKIQTFDYSALDDDTKAVAMQAADFIRERQRQAVRSIIDIGTQLVVAKECLGHGRFCSWLEAEFGWSDRTAQRYMQAATAFAGKSDTVSDLPPTTVYKLASKSTPVEVREDIITKIEAGEPVSVEAINEIVHEARDREREAKAEAKLTEKQKRYRARRKANRERERAEHQERQQQEKVEAKVAASALLEAVGCEAARQFLAAYDCAGFWAMMSELRVLVEELRP